MSDYLTSSELADLVGCQPNQRACMIRWLEKNGWAFVVDCIGAPKVLRLYRDRRLGVSDDPKTATVGDFEPDFAALDEWHKNRRVRSRRGQR
ncbi:DUF4224 domain-containing protein [Paraburkholderia nodosa]|uniref:DUF4224 domain-containing protein n=1 Tax=Paraburkholderia nodosa TaxID=392320 RepID=UPI00114D319F|nr:DUF4224 domain-containing protein [Paraburkholderia nodosa]